MSALLLWWWLVGWSALAQKTYNEVHICDFRGKLKQTHYLSGLPYHYLLTIPAVIGFLQLTLTLNSCTLHNIIWS